MASEQAELPRSVRKGPLITVTCECGQRRDLHYGERWQCESCGRRFDTNKIPLEEYAAIRRTQLRYRLVPLGAGLVLLAAMIAFFIAGSAVSAVVAVAFLVASWSMFGRPFFRSRYRRALSKNLPKWEIKSD
jgi:Flp pilus assembly protein TadB